MNAFLTSHYFASSRRLSGGRSQAMRLAFRFRGPNIARQPECLKRTDHIPTHVNLPPLASKAGRIHISVMIPVPVLSPRSQLQWSQPPDIPTGVYAFRQSGCHMQEAVDDHLHVQHIDQSDGANPKEPFPTQEQPREDGKCDDRYLKRRPNPIPGLV